MTTTTNTATSSSNRPAFRGGAVRAAGLVVVLAAVGAWLGAVAPSAGASTPTHPVVPVQVAPGDLSSTTTTAMPFTPRRPGGTVVPEQHGGYVVQRPLGSGTTTTTVPVWHTPVPAAAPATPASSPSAGRSGATPSGAAGSSDDVPTSVLDAGAAGSAPAAAVEAAAPSAAAPAAVRRTAASRPVGVVVGLGVVLLVLVGTAGTVLVRRRRTAA